MPTHDHTHFDEYTEQNRAKHAILSAYLPSYLNALKKQVDGFHYIDAFAGCGVYEGRYPGSPLLVLDIIQEARLSKRTAVSLVEKDEGLWGELRTRVQSSAVCEELHHPPAVLLGPFSSHAQTVLGDPIYHRGARIGRFCFVDPCGVAGVRMSDLVALLDRDFAELLLLFNYSGVNRLLGGLRAGTHDQRILIELLGSAAELAALESQLSDCTTSSGREIVVRDHFVSSLRHHSRARYFVPFRFESKGQERTSHYLVHCSGHRLAFKIMKHVMSETGRQPTDRYGRLEFINDAERGTQFELFRRDVDGRREQILERLRRSPCRVEHFSTDWMCRPEDPFSAKDYKTMLLDLESERRLTVFDPSNRQPYPAKKRPRRSGHPTMADALWLRIAQK